MKFLLSLGMAVVLATPAPTTVAAEGFTILKTQGIGLLYHGCTIACQPDSDVTITNNSGQVLRMTINGHRFLVQPHHDMEINL